jgi:hypothetical protein
MKPEYSWTLTDREHRPNVIRNEAEVTYNFDLAGNFSLEGVVFLNQVEHSVRWLIAVNSVLWWWRPHETEITVEIDEPIEFTALPFNDVGEHTVTAIVHDGVEVDTVVWTIMVNPNAVDYDRTSLLPTEVTLYPAAPNPFNSTTSIRYFLPRSADVSLTVYDSAGRLVQTLSEGLTASGEHRATIQGADLPTGVYLLRLETGNASRSMKVVLLK